MSVRSSAGRPLSASTRSVIAPGQLLDLGRGEEGLDDRVAAGVVDRLRLLAPHKRKVLFTGEESCSGGRHPLNGYLAATLREQGERIASGRMVSHALDERCRSRRQNVGLRERDAVVRWHYNRRGTPHAAFQTLLGLSAHHEPATYRQIIDRAA